MFKDYNKYLSTSLKVYLFVLLFIFILKLVGLDYFGIDINNLTYLKFNNFILKYKLENIYYSFTLYFYVYMYVSICCRDNSKKTKLYCILFTLVFILIKVFEVKIANTIIIFIIEFLYVILICLIYNKFKDKKVIIKRSVKLLILNTLFQLISLYLRNINYYNVNLSFLIRTILDLDYILMFLIYYKCVFNKGGVKLCGEEVFLSLQKKMNLKTLLKKSQKSWHNFKKKPKTERLAIFIYLAMSIIWNLLSLIVILLIAKLNNTFVECIFILTSFWLSKKAFGKPFHLPSMAQCFVVSNLTYYGLNRITTPLGISIIIPILLGVGLSYVTSKLVKKLYKPLYRGMPKELFDETILKVTDKNSDKYKICYDYFILKKSAINLSLKYNYSEVGIRKIKDRVNEQIKKLN